MRERDQIWPSLILFIIFVSSVQSRWTSNGRYNSEFSEYGPPSTLELPPTSRHETYDAHTTPHDHHHPSQNSAYRRVSEEEEDDSRETSTHTYMPPSSSSHNDVMSDPSMGSDEEFEYRHHQSYHPKTTPPSISSDYFEEHSAPYSHPPTPPPQPSSSYPRYHFDRRSERPFYDDHFSRPEYEYEAPPPPKRYRSRRPIRRQYDTYDEEFEEFSPKRPRSYGPPRRYPDREHRDHYSREPWDRKESRRYSSMESMRRAPLRESFDEEEPLNPRDSHAFDSSDFASTRNSRGSSSRGANSGFDQFEEASQDMDKALMENFLHNNRMSSLMASDSIQEEDTSSPSSPSSSSTSSSSGRDRERDRERDRDRDRERDRDGGSSYSSINSFKSLMNPFSSFSGFGGIFSGRSGSRRSRRGRKGSSSNDDKEDDDNDNSKKDDGEEGSCDETKTSYKIVDPPEERSTSVLPSTTLSVTTDSSSVPKSLEYFYTESVLIPTTLKDASSSSPLTSTTNYSL